MATYTIAGEYEAIASGVLQVRYITFFVTQPGKVNISGKNTGANGTGDSASMHLFAANESSLTAVNAGSFTGPVEVNFLQPGLYVLAISEEGFSAAEAETGRNVDDDAPPFGYEVTFTEVTTIISPPRDAVIGTDVTETLSGTSFGEYILAHGGDDTINAGGGGDFIDARGGVNTINAEGGDDVIAFSEGSGVANGGSGGDTLVMDFRNLSGAIVVAEDPVVNEGEGGFDGSFTFVETDEVIEFTSVETFVIRSGSGNDTIVTGDGDDFVDGGAGDDFLDGGDGFDAVSYASAASGVNVDLARLDPQNTVGAGTDTLENFEHFQGSEFNDTVYGTDQNNIIGTSGGADFVEASNGGDDRIATGAGRDVIYYGAALTAADRNNGGDAGGDPRGDLIIIQGNYNIVLAAESLVDVEKLRVLRGSNTDFGDTAGSAYTYNITTIEENVANGGRLVVQGGSLAANEKLTFDGSAETDGSFQLFGGRGEDVLRGGANADHLLGRAGDDELVGNGGDDRLRGGLGQDWIDGGSGSDVIVLAGQGGEEGYPNAVSESTGATRDVLVGFNFAEDRIDLPVSVSSLLSDTEGMLSEESFDADLAAALGTFASGAAVLFTADGGDLADRQFLIVDADGSGAYESGNDFVFELKDAVGPAPATPDFFI